MLFMKIRVPKFSRFIYQRPVPPPKIWKKREIEVEIQKTILEYTPFKNVFISITRDLCTPTYLKTF
jgi:hypothetical protein